MVSASILKGLGPPRPSKLEPSWPFWRPTRLFFGCFFFEFCLMATWRPPNWILEAPGLDFGGPGPRFWRRFWGWFWVYSMSKTSILKSNFFLVNTRFFGFSWGRVSKWDPRADPRSVTIAKYLGFALNHQKLSDVLMCASLTHDEPFNRGVWGDFG